MKILKSCWAETLNDEELKTKNDIEKLCNINLAWSRIWEYPFAVINSNLTRDITVLDAGSGKSIFPEYLSRFVKEVYVIDTIDTGYKEKNIHTRRCDIRNISHNDNTFDRTFCVSVIEHIEGNIEKSFNELLRVTKKDGLLILTLDVNISSSERQISVDKFKDFLHKLNIQFNEPEDNALKGPLSFGEGLFVYGIVIQK